MLLDQIAFEDERFLVRRGEDEFQGLGAIHHDLCLVWDVPRGLEVGQNPSFKILRLAHIDRPAGPVLENIDTRSFRRMCPQELGIQLVLNRLGLAHFLAISFCPNSTRSLLWPRANSHLEIRNSKFTRLGG